MTKEFDAAAQPAKKNVYVVYTNGLLDSLNAASTVDKLLQETNCAETPTVYYIDTGSNVPAERSSDVETFVQNCHGFTQTGDQKASTIFADHLRTKYDIDSKCLASELNAPANMALFDMFEKENAENVVVVTTESQEEVVRNLVKYARRGCEGMKKHVDYTFVESEVPTFKNGNTQSCPNKAQYDRQI